VQLQALPGEVSASSDNDDGDDEDDAEQGGRVLGLLLRRGALERPGPVRQGDSAALDDEGEHEDEEYDAREEDLHDAQQVAAELGAATAVHSRFSVKVILLFVARAEQAVPWFVCTLVPFMCR
jgi:hypothetical protein